MKVRLFQIGLFGKDNHTSHTDKHYKEYINDVRFQGVDYPSEEFDSRYNQIATKLSNIRVDKSDSESHRFVGYISKDKRQIKYDKKTWDYLVMSADGKTIITLHKKSPKEYKRVLKKTFLSELDYNKEEVQ